MKKSSFITLALSAALFLGYTANASANHFTSANISANCINNGEGYSIEYNIVASLHAWRVENIVDYELTITGDSGTTATSGSFTIIKPPDTYDFSGGLSSSILVDECGTYEITGSVTLRLDVGEISTLGPITVICECGATGCARTPGYWKNHLEAWPVTELTIGGITYSQADLLVMLNAKVRGNIDVILIKHLIAAKLNVLSNALNPTIQDIINNADAYVSSSDVNNRAIAEPIKDALDDFNNSGNCD